MSIFIGASTFVLFLFAAYTFGIATGMWLKGKK